MAKPSVDLVHAAAVAPPGSSPDAVTPTGPERVAMQTLDDRSTMILCYGFIMTGMLIQALNTVHAVRIAIRKPRIFNIGLAVFSLGFYGFFLSLLATTRSVYQNSPDESYVLATLLMQSPVRPPYVERYVSAMTCFSFFWGTSIYIGILVFQLRFQLIRVILPYREIWDWLWWSITTALYLIYIYFNVVKYSPGMFAHTCIGAAWTLYVITCDNVLSFIFLYRLFRSINFYGASNAQRHTRRVIIGLVGSCSVSWIALIMFIVSQFTLIEIANQNLQYLLFVIVMMLTPFQFTGELMFMYAVEQMVTNTSHHIVAVVNSLAPSPPSDCSLFWSRHGRESGDGAAALVDGHAPFARRPPSPRLGPGPARRPLRAAVAAAAAGSPTPTTAFLAAARAHPFGRIGDPFVDPETILMIEKEEQTAHEFDMAADVGGLGDLSGGGYTSRAGPGGASPGRRLHGGGGGGGGSMAAMSPTAYVLHPGETWSRPICPPSILD
ncbi:hypothetical protein CXG81DRAFT_24896 [Caulochytrium protostelioides]|uniref:Uncharacterized protein n=1 Tax=Caulochytrium protostelioides TaxID=1555241 RepID=A0A4P9XAN3_9FUNG|nr:hypothetical protein CXG81DRAFT_24896 [Caulochytrium protostelioides]|eukprot:RKP02434.1 hypothetical protein CXG81DRAFT_24896 [Caulochytrium protostelioides]